MKTITLAMLAAFLPLVSAGCATRTTEVAPAPATTVIANPDSAPVVVASPAMAGVLRITGRVVDIDRNGEIRVKMDDGKKIELRVPRATAATLREGDPVTLDVTFGR